MDTGLWNYANVRKTFYQDVLVRVVVLGVFVDPGGDRGWYASAAYLSLSESTPGNTNVW